MRIAVDCRALQEPKPSGVGWYTFFQLKHLIESAPQHQFELCILSHYPDGALLARAQKEFVGSNIHWRLTRAPKRFVTFSIAVGMWRSWTWLFGECDVLWMPNLHFVPRTQPPFPVVLTVHDLSFERYPAYLPLKGRFWHRMLRTMLTRATRLVCVSKSTAREVSAVYGVPERRCVVVYPGIEQLNGGGHTFPVQPRIISVSTIEPRKNIDALIDAYVEVKKELPSIECVVIGKAGYHAQATVDRMRVAGVEYRGYATEDEKERLYSSASVMVYPSVYEGFGLPPLEAQLHGIPVIATTTTSLPEVLGDSAVLCDPNDARSIACAILTVVHSPSYASVLQERGYANVRRFEWSRAAHELLAVFKSTYGQ
ncbi:MAG: glycosyltransferase family 4 protein [Candidatus Kerfeldbacteria bacterium]|nr:glycosyltransferase family 4 protein [Candidatus Kerfeldbacteria bacterium]